MKIIINKEQEGNRIDSVIFLAPFAYILLMFINI